MTYIAPPLDLLTAGSANRVDAVDHTQAITKTLMARGVDAKVADVQHGAAFSRYLLALADGVDPAKIERAVSSLDLATGTQVRYAGQIGGYVALEVPAAARTSVRLRDCIERGEALHSLGIVLGQDVAGTSIMGHLVRAPHLLVAGATGQGKSVFLNAAILSLLMRNTPDDLELAMIDPKRVELSVYAGLPHLIAPIVSDVTEAAMLLDDTVAEMERRYGAMEDAGVQDIGAWNTKASRGSASTNGTGADAHWPRRVVVIDELADLMMTQGKAVESKIARIGQLGRAAGIHLIVATQSPRASVLTGMIKANIPTTLALTVASATESTVTGVPGAHRLAGQGDALWSLVGTSTPIRVQTPLVTRGEVEAVVTWWREHWIVDTAVDEDGIDDDGPLIVELNGGGDIVYGEQPVVHRQAASVTYLPRPKTEAEIDVELKQAVIDRIKQAGRTAAGSPAVDQALEARVAALESIMVSQTRMLEQLVVLLSTNHNQEAQHG